MLYSNRYYLKLKNIHSRLFLRRGSSSTLFNRYSFDAKGKRTCSIKLGKRFFLQLAS